ncbi:MAG: homoserine dehydrogenase [Lachnospiraceae bacterium]|nr:homoserine dehydrogenase [Lachnospiraceae bacterium]
MSKVAVMGYGTVGSGVVEVLTTNAQSISMRAGEEVEVKYVLDLRDFPGSPVENKLVKDFNVIVNDAEVDIVVETMGGLHPAYEFVKASLEAGKSVCTSNKELVAAYGAELLEIARDNNINFLFEASVGGGIPIIRPLKSSLTADEIEEITGILNGTTNYILTKMRDNGSAFEEVLKEAQELGYAERNPEADVEGYDACRKIAILTSLAYGKQVDFEDIYTEGITAITAEDFLYAKAIGTTIKLVGTSKIVNGKVVAMVAPVLISADSPLYSVDDVFNGIYVRGNMLGDVMFYGKGAGKLPTASAVVADVVEAVKHKGTNIMTIWSKDKQELVDFSEAAHRFFVRINNSEGIAEKVEKLFGAVKTIDIGIADEYAFVTDEMTESAFADKQAEVSGVISRIRFAD